MRDKLSIFLTNAITFLLLAVAGLTPLLFLNQTTEFFEIPKLVFLIVSTVLLLGLWIFSWIVRGKISISRTPLDFAMILLLIAVIVSAIVSPTRLVSIYGNFPRVHGSAVSWAIYIILFFITVSHLRTTKNIKYLIYVLTGSGVVISIVSLLSFFGLFLPFDFAKTVNFTPTGSSFTTIAFLLMLLPLPVVSLLNKNKFMPLPVAVAITLLFGATIVLTGSIPYVVILALVFGACLLITNPKHIRSNLVYFLFPAAIVTVLVLLAYLPLSGPLGFLHNLENNFPKEIQLPIATSWKVSASSFTDAPIFGTGPSSYAFNFSAYKPVEFNNYPFWNFTFDTAYNEFFHFLGTLGIFGLGALLLIVLIILRSSKRNLSIRKHDALDSEDTSILLAGLTISAIIAVILFAVHATTLVSLVTTFFIFAAFLMSQRSVREKVTELSMGIKATSSGNNKFDLFPVIVFILFLIVAIPFLTRVFKATAADYYHRQALNQSAKNGTLTYQNLQKAESLNPNIALYRIDMAQTNFALANALATQKGPTKENPQGSLTDQDKQTIQTLLSQAINEGRVAVALSPRSAANWEILGSIYRNITGVAQNALQFALASYGQAIQRDPVNPALRVSVGGIYYAGQNYPLASRFFSDAANLKSDYPNAYYNLAITLRDNNDLTNAVLVAQQLVNMLNKDQKSADYKTAVDLLADLKAKLANQEQQKVTQQAPAAQGNGALQNPNLPNVTTLNNPPKVSPAPTVKPNPNTNLPANVSPTPVKATPSPAQ
jgi:tetratricopeptide (TPR) repeat protein